MAFDKITNLIKMIQGDKSKILRGYRAFNSSPLGIKIISERYPRDMKDKDRVKVLKNSS